MAVSFGRFYYKIGKKKTNIFALNLPMKWGVRHIYLVELGLQQLIYRLPIWRPFPSPIKLAHMIQGGFVCHIFVIHMPYSNEHRFFSAQRAKGFYVVRPLTLWHIFEAYSLQVWAVGLSKSFSQRNDAPVIAIAIAERTLSPAGQKGSKRKPSRICLSA